jgi:hypothetical protein
MVRANQDTFSTLRAESVLYFMSPDCSGTAFMLLPSNQPQILAPNVIIGQTLYVGAFQPLPPIAQQSNQLPSGMCQTRSGTTISNVVPMVGTLDLQSLGSAPYRVVHNP